MRKFLILIQLTIISGALFAGGLVTNTNQSVLYTRLQSRNASTTIDAVYYNPAGLTKLQDGIYFSLNNQTIGQEKKILSDYTYLTGTPREFIGNVSAPLFPGIYVAYKTGKLAFSGGFNPIGGGGGAKYKKGLPSFEMQVADIGPILQTELAPLDAAFLAGTGTDPFFRNITGYNTNIYFKGNSVYFGYQANVSYEINKMISVALGGRLVTAKNRYNGYVKDVTIAVPASYGESQAPGNYLRFVAALPGVPSGTAGLLIGGATDIDTKTAIVADVEETGTGVTPIIDINITPFENLNISLKYEFKTKLELTTKVFNDDNAGGMFINGGKTIDDMPAMFAAGVEYKPMDKLMVTGSFNYYDDKNVDYDGSGDVDLDLIDKNFVEFALGAEYGLSEKLSISAGWLKTITGVNTDYQNDQKYSLNTNSFGAGFGYRITPMIYLNIGGQYTFYKEGSKSFTHNVGGLSVWPLPVKETYNEHTWILAAGLDFFFGKSK